MGMTQITRARCRARAAARTPEDLEEEGAAAVLGRDPVQAPVKHPPPLPGGRAFKEPEEGGKGRILQVGPFLGRSKASRALIRKKHPKKIAAFGIGPLLFISPPREGRGNE